MYRIIDAATRSQLNDQETYLFNPAISWNRQFQHLNIPKEEQLILQKKIIHLWDGRLIQMEKEMDIIGQDGVEHGVIQMDNMELKIIN